MAVTGHRKFFGEAIGTDARVVLLEAVVVIIVHLGREATVSKQTQRAGSGADKETKLGPQVITSESFVGCH